MKRRLGVTAAALAVALGCDGPTVGDLTYNLAMPYSRLGAVAFSAIATEPETVVDASAACTGCQAYTFRVSDRELRAIVVGDIGPGPLVHVTVSNVGKREAYVAVVLEAAGTDLNLVRASDLQLALAPR